MTFKQRLSNWGANVIVALMVLGVLIFIGLLGAAPWVIVLAFAKWLFS